MDITDQSLVNLVVDENDLTAFNRLMKRHEDGVYRMALMYCKSKESAFDITQDVFVKVFQNLKSFRGDSTFKTWLYKIVYYESLNWIRKNKKFKYNQDIDEIEFAISSNSYADDAVLKKERYKTLNDSMDKLNKKYKTVVYLKYFENLSLKEIAKIVNTTEGTIKNILFRSVRKLQDIMKPEFEEIR